MKSLLNIFRKKNDVLEFTESTPEINYVSNLIYCADKEHRVYKVTENSLPTLSHRISNETEDIDPKKVINRLKVLSGFTPEKTTKELNGKIIVRFAGSREVIVKTTFKTDQSVEIIKENG